MDQARNTECTPLVPSEADDAEFEFSDKKRGRYLKMEWADVYFWLVFLELINLFFGLCACLIVMTATAPRQHQVDNYTALSQSSRTWNFVNNSLPGVSEQADFYSESWADIATRSGIVTVTEAWAAEHKLPESAPNPDSPGELVYQLDGFQNLHCLDMIRRRLLGDDMSARQVSHCVDYLRRALMCNMDVTLLAIDTDAGAQASTGVHSCRDYDAILRWTDEKRWKSTPKWLLEQQD